MDYLVFDTQEQAANVEGQIYQAGAALAASRGYDVDETGIGGKAGTSQSVTRTVRWDILRQRADGKWIVRHPKHFPLLQTEPELLALLDAALDGVTVETAQADWFGQGDGV